MSTFNRVPHAKSARCTVAARAVLIVLLILLGSRVSGGERAPVMMVLGDSLSAGYGLSMGQGWVDLLQSRLRTEGYPYRVVNASISGDTSYGGLTRLPVALANFAPDIVLIELGGNDGLRGMRPQDLRENLESMAVQVRAAGALVLLLGVRMPPNYGLAYTRRFQQAFQDAARTQEVPLVPHLLDGVAARPELMQADGIHPRAEAQARILDNVWPQLEPLLGGP